MKIKSTFIFCNLLFALNAYSQTDVDDSIFTGGIYRQYRLYIPAIYDGSEPVPLVFNLHGYTSFNTQQEYYGDFRPIADTANFIIVLPNGTYDAFGFRYWNCFGAIGSGVDDVAFLSNLIDSIKLTYNIDNNAIYSTGMSNGGFMSYELACRLSNRIAAIASVSGDITNVRLNACDPQHPMPVMEIHGTADGTVPYNGSGDFLPLDTVINYWVKFNNCETPPTITEIPDIVTTDGSTAQQQVYANGNNNANVELFKILGGGHAWPGSAVTFFAVTNQDINASLEIWKFFRRYRLDALTGIKNENTASGALNIFPNPFNTVLNIELQNNAGQVYISVYDITGRKIYSAKNIFANNPLQVNTQNWINGIYILQVNEAGKTSSYKIVKNDI